MLDAEHPQFDEDIIRLAKCGMFRNVKEEIQKRSPVLEQEER